MTKRIIKLKYPAKCRECGADLPVGSRAKYYNRNSIYGVDCHSRNSKPLTKDRAIAAYENGEINRGRLNSILNPYGAYTPDGTKIGSSCGCEDYPCCGH